MRAKAESLAHCDAEGAAKQAQYVSKELPGLEKMLRGAAKGMSLQGKRAQTPNITNKLAVLFELLDEMRDTFGREVLGIVFVETVASTYPLADIINEYFDQQLAGWLWCSMCVY